MHKKGCQHKLTAFFLMYLKEKPIKNNNLNL